MERDDIAPKHKAKISIPAAIYRVLRNFCSRSYDPEHRTCAFKKDQISKSDDSDLIARL